MDQIIDSAKKGNVANFPLKLNLQLFADDGTPNLEDLPDEELEEEAPADEPKETETPEVVDPEPEKLQDDKTNKAFAEMRRQNEALQKQMEFVKKYGQYGVTSEEEIAAKFGPSHGIYTAKQLDMQLESDRKARERAEWKEQGIDPDAVEKVVDEKLRNHPAVLEAEKARQDMMLVTNFQQLTTQFGEHIKTPDDVPPEVWAKWNMGNARWGDGSSMSLAEVYTLLKGPEIQQKKTTQIRQAAIDKAISKDHIKPNGGSSEVETIEVPNDVFRQYKALNPKATDAEIRKHYKNSLKG